MAVKNGLHHAGNTKNPTAPVSSNPNLGQVGESLLVSIKEAGSALGVSRAMIYKLLKGGELKGVRLGGRSMIPAQGLRDYVTSLATYTLAPEEAAASPTLGKQDRIGRKLRYKAVMALTGLSRRELFVRRNEGTFPKGVKLSSGVLGWDRSDVEAWIADPAGYRDDSES